MSAAAGRWPGLVHELCNPENRLVIQKVSSKNTKATMTPTAKRRAGGQKIYGPPALRGKRARAAPTRAPWHPRRTERPLCAATGCPRSGRWSATQSRHHQPRRDHLQPLHGRQERKQGAELVRLEVVLLAQKHGRRHRRQAEGAVRLENGRRVQAAESAGEFGLDPVRRVERGMRANTPR